MTAKTEQTFSFEIVSCLLAALSDSGTVVGSKHYKMMAQVDGSRTASGYEHLFRAVKARAKEISVQIASGQIDASAPTPKKTGAPKSGTPASGRKRGRKAAAENEPLVAEEDDDEDKVSPSKKVKAEDSEDSDGRL